MRIVWVLIAFVFLISLPALAQEKAVSKKANFRVVTVAHDLDHPWRIAFLPNGDMLVTERRGKLFRLTQKGDKTEINGVPSVHAKGQGGLFDIALAPDFQKNGTIFFSYAAPADGDNNTELARARLDLNNNRLEDVNVIFRAQPKLKGDNHYGAKILIVQDGTIFLTLGERFDYRDEAQNKANHLGTIVHIDQNGRAAPGNPLIGQKDAKAEIFTYGHRNVQGIAVQPGTGRIWIHEHGPKGGDEINILKAGANYGWPKITYGVDYSGAIISDKTALPGMEQPVIHWTPSIAPSGMIFYSGKQFPAWRGNIFVGALVQKHLRRLEVEGDKIVDQEVLLMDLGERIRDVRESPDGTIYLTTDSDQGRILRLEPVSN